MQTFLPSPDFAESARVLDRARLGKQRVETLQIAKALTDPEYGWQNHPAVKMWRGHFCGLVTYGIAVCEEWVDRGYNDTCNGKLIDIYAQQWDAWIDSGDSLMHEPLGLLRPTPPWLGDEAFHASHRSVLLRKAPDHYRKFWPDEPDDLEYVWPVP